MAAESPLPVTAASRPTAAPSTTTVSHSILSKAPRNVIQPVNNMARLASRAALSMLITPNAAEHIFVFLSFFESRQSRRCPIRLLSARLALAALHYTTCFWIVLQ